MRLHECADSNFGLRPDATAAPEPFHEAAIAGGIDAEPVRLHPRLFEKILNLLKQGYAG